MRRRAEDYYGKPATPENITGLLMGIFDDGTANPDDEACSFCGERLGDHTEEMTWRCSRGE